MILEPGGRCLPRSASPVAEKDAFVLYDEARCRGSDLQLRPDAVGLLTLGPATCKDKMMQAAGRLRMFGRGQKLRFAASEDVTAKVRLVNDLLPLDSPKPVDVLQWVMRNTTQATLRGTVDWARQGLFFASSLGLPDAVLQDEVTDVRDLYTQGRYVMPAPELVHAMSRQGRVQDALLDGSPAAERRSRLVGQILDSCTEHGSGHMVVAGMGVDEECERELEKEEEEEEEVEREVARMQPAQESDWNYSSVLDAASIAALPPAAGVVPLQQLVSSLQPADIGRLSWPPQLYVTANFMRTVDGTKPQGEYLRPVKALLLFPDGTTVLVSERESDALLELLWATGRVSRNSGGGGKAPLLLSLSYAQLGYKGGQQRSGGGGSSSSAVSLRLACSVSSAGWAPLDAAGMAALRWLGVAELVAMHLFGGGTEFGTSAEMQELHRLMRRRLRAAEALTEARGRQSMLSRSGLEKACGDVL